MRFAIHQAGEVATRAGRILLAERDLSTLGLVDKHPNEKDPRLEHVEVLATYDALLTDSTDPEEQIESALQAEISCVVWVDADEEREHYHEAFEALGLTLLTGCNLATGVAPALTAHEVAAADTVLEVTTAWTEPGTARRRGEAVAFPEPVGSRWGEARPSEYADRAYAVRISGPWAAAMARVTGGSESGVVTRIVGVSDLAVHLEALALATGAMVVAGYAPGGARPADEAETYLTRALATGLDVAAHTHYGN